MAMAVCGHTWMAVDAAVVWTWQWLQGVKSDTVAHGADQLEEGEMDRKLAAIGEHQASIGLGGGGSLLEGTDCT